MTPPLVPVYRRIRLVPTLAAIVVIAAGLALGNWQLNRAAEKLALQNELEARSALPPLKLEAMNTEELGASELKYRRARATGHYLAAGQILIDNRALGDETGYYVLTPLSMGKTVLMVNRGFFAKNQISRELPDVPVPSELVEVEGELSPGKTRFLELSSETVQGKLWQNFKPDEYSKFMGYQVAPWVLNLGQPAPGLKAVVDQPDLGIDTHRGYAFQWFALTATTACLYVYFTFFRKPATPK